MRNLKLIRIAIILIAAGLLLFLIFYARTGAYTLNSFFQGVRVSAYSHLSFVGNFISELKTIRSLTEENIRLKEKNQEFLSRLANEENLEEQNYFLREALNLPMLGGYEILDVGIFNLQLTPKGHYLLINKGANDDIKEEDIVISSSGILIGTVEEVFGSYSKVATVTDVGFKATISVVFKEISGIANGAGENGISIDFISQTDEVAEGDIIATRGNDVLPPGLIIGKVVGVSSSGSLFKDVKVKPALEEINLSRALIIKK